MISDFEPIIFNTPTEFACAEIYVVHDLHKGSAQHDSVRWNALKAEILAEPNRYVIFVGDMMENAVPGSKSDVFCQTSTPHEQKMWVVEQLKALGDRVICVIDGNHERNRTTKLVGMYPLYDACVMAGIENRYRPHFCLIDIGVGSRNKSIGKQARYFGYCVHKARDQKNFSTADMVDGIDFFCYGHDHEPKDRPRSKLVYDAKNKKLTQKEVQVINSGSFLTYGGYAADNAYRPASCKMFKMLLSGGRKRDITTIGFYV